jgi:hypothetical protein
VAIKKLGDNRIARLGGRTEEPGHPALPAALAPQPGATREVAMAEKPRASVERLFALRVIAYLKQANCSNGQLVAIVKGTVETTISFLRFNRRYALEGNPTISQLVDQEFNFENALLGSIMGALPPRQKRGRRKGHTDPDTLKKFFRIWELKSEGKNWKEISEALIPEFGWSTADACQKIYARYYPYLIKDWRKRFQPNVPEEEFLQSALERAKGRPGRPKSRQNSPQ